MSFLCRLGGQSMAAMRLQGRLQQLSLRLALCQRLFAVAAGSKLSLSQSQSCNVTWREGGYLCTAHTGKAWCIALTFSWLPLTVARARRLARRLADLAEAGVEIPGTDAQTQLTEDRPASCPANPGLAVQDWLGITSQKPKGITCDVI